jgi:hypothetical protein
MYYTRHVLNIAAGIAVPKILRVYIAQITVPVRAKETAMVAVEYQGYINVFGFFKIVENSFF